MAAPIEITGQQLTEAAELTDFVSRLEEPGAPFAAMSGSYGENTALIPASIEPKLRSALIDLAKHELLARGFQLIA